MASCRIFPFASYSVYDLMKLIYNVLKNMSFLSFSKGHR